MALRFPGAAGTWCAGRCRCFRRAEIPLPPAYQLTALSCQCCCCCVGDTKHPLEAYFPWCTCPCQPRDPVPLSARQPAVQRALLSGTSLLRDRAALLPLPLALQRSRWVWGCCRGMLSGVRRGCACGGRGGCAVRLHPLVLSLHTAPGGSAASRLTGASHKNKLKGNTGPACALNVCRTVSPAPYNTPKGGEIELVAKAVTSSCCLPS